MPNRGNRFKNAVISEIDSWGEGIDIETEKPVGYRFVDSPRKVDIILKKGDKFLAIEAKIQETSGTAYQKLSYTLEDCKSSPIPTIIVFAGSEIKDDIKSKLILSGIGLEVKFIPDDKSFSKDKIVDKELLFRQRVYMELGLDWFKLF